MLNRNDIANRALKIAGQHSHQQGPLLPILHDIQAEFGYLPEDALIAIADELNISRAEIHGVASFYHDFKKAPQGKHVLKICRAEACQAVGSDQIGERASSKLQIEFGNTTSDGQVTLEAVYCLGLCACGPAAMLDGKVFGQLDETRLDTLIGECVK